MSTMNDIGAELARTARAQGDAADPQASVWVSANAGTGKTHVLTMRVLRLMLAGTPPERILCLTYTKAAAAEMSKRVFDTLAQWVTISDAALAATLTKLLGSAPDAAGIARARTLFATAIETPGGLKVQTIHAFCERLLQRFPLEAGVPPGFSILDDETAGTLRREAIDVVLTRATQQKMSPLGQALSFAVAYAADDHFDDVLAETLKHRDWLASAAGLDAQGDIPFSNVEVRFREAFSVRASIDLPTLERELAQCLSDAQISRIREALRSGGKSDVKAESQLAAAAAAPNLSARCEALTHYFLTKSGEPRKSLMTKALVTAYPDLDELLQRAQSRCVALANERASLRSVMATMALHRLAGAVRETYAEAKSRRAALDFHDLIERTRQLLSSDRNQSTEWVLFKLDGGLDHLLVDESQDTSPAQWAIVEALAREFFAGAGTRNEARTLFAVGDEKQSIYSFQGAAPEKFAEMGRHFSGAAQAAGAAWNSVPLDLSFRTVAPVLDAVDAVFADPMRTPGLTSHEVTPIRHIAKRAGQAGLVEIWPTEVYEADTPGDVWSPLADMLPATPTQRLASRIADTIAGWLSSGEMLASENRKIRPGDILILVRNRRPFVTPMVAELKQRGVPVAGADRILLADQIAVQDLLVLGDFLTLPEDDLALATLLKSPMFELDDDDLLVLAPGRKGTLWKALLDNAAVNARFKPAADTLKRWRKSADFTPPFEFFADLLDNEGMRAKLLARLGPDAADSIDEFLNLALTYDDGAPPSLSGFVHWLRDDSRMVKRDMEQGRDEVRIMTVHGAKGLEAGIVFLPDTCTTEGGGQRGGPIAVPDLRRAGDAADPFVWQVKGSSGLAPIASANAAQAVRDRAERNRLLYVAMTRARDRLYVTGFENKNGRKAGCWYDLIDEALPGSMQTFETPHGPVKRLSSAQVEPTEAPKFTYAAELAPAPLPQWALGRAPKEPQLTMPLAPSRLVPYETDATGEPVSAPPPRQELAEPPPLTPAVLADQSRFLRGTLTHALLEHLPGFDRKNWTRLAKAFVAERGAGLTSRTQASIVSETLAILNDPDFAPLFGPGSAAEVPLVAIIPRPSGQGVPLRLTGQIDRLVDTGREVLIVDYKTNRPPPATLEQVADAYIYQLAAYCVALEQIFPERLVRAAILWTDGPRIMEIPQERLIRYASKLWELDKLVS